MVFVSVIGFFFTMTSSLTYGVFVMTGSSLFKGMDISVLDSTGPSIGDEYCSEADCVDGCIREDDSELTGLLSIVTSSWVTQFLLSLFPLWFLYNVYFIFGNSLS